MSAEISITLSGPIGAGKTALMIEIAEHLKSFGLSVQFTDPNMVESEKRMMPFDTSRERFEYLAGACGHPLVTLREVISK